MRRLLAIAIAVVGATGAATAVVTVLSYEAAYTFDVAANGQNAYRAENWTTWAGAIFRDHEKLQVMPDFAGAGIEAEIDDQTIGGGDAFQALCRGTGHVEANAAAAYSSSDTSMRVLFRLTGSANMYGNLLMRQFAEEPDAGMMSHENEAKLTRLSDGAIIFSHFEDDGFYDHQYGISESNMAPGDYLLELSARNVLDAPVGTIWQSNHSEAVINLQFDPVPEPATALVIGVALVLFRRRR